MNFKNSVSLISTYCFLLSLSAFIAIDEYLMPTLIGTSRVLSISLSFLSTLGIYGIVFQTTFSVYSRFLYRRFNRKMNISGKWYQIMEISDRDNVADALRYGPCMIDSEVDQIHFSGQNYRTGNDRSISSNWQSTAISISNRQLNVLFTSEGVNRPNHLRTSHGTMKYQIVGDPPHQLHGTFHDVFPSTNSGIITIYKYKSEYESRLRELQSEYDSQK